MVSLNLLLPYIIAFYLSTELCNAWSIFRNNSNNKQEYDYDLIIIGAGAAGLFASGAASMFGGETCLIEYQSVVGGDCTNAACVPSKALRSFALQSTTSNKNNNNVLECQKYVYDTVRTVQERESFENRPQNDNLDVHIVSECNFIDSNTIRIKKDDHEKEKLIKGKKFLITTGAQPIIPNNIRDSANAANMHLSTYRSLLNPKSNDILWDILAKNNDSCTRLLVVGGGATACELSQSLVRIINNNNNNNTVSIVAPAILPNEDITLQQSAVNMLRAEGIKWYQGRLIDINHDKSIIVRHKDNTTFSIDGPFDAILLCIGRTPQSLQLLDLEKVPVEFDIEQGIKVSESLHSISAKHVYAAGDCCNVISGRLRTASQAAWTGFHAVRNMKLPQILLLGDRSSVNVNIPRVIYMDPEMACVGLTYKQCVEKYGLDGFDSMCIFENGTDRADMERIIRNTDICFVEIRAEKRTGRILGCTTCSPAAAEITNNFGVAITNGLSVTDIAISTHSYPSYGYLPYRVALAMTLSSVWGSLEICGPIGISFAKLGRSGATLIYRIKNAIAFISTKRSSQQKQRDWEVEGSIRSFSFCEEDGNDGWTRILSYNEFMQNKTLLDCALSILDSVDENKNLFVRKNYKDLSKFLNWYHKKPN